MNDIADRRLEEKERRRLEIVQAAEALYADRGWDAVTMEQLAQRARLSRALVYVYFRDKDDLHLAIVQRSLDELRARFRAAADAAETGLAKVEAIGRAYVAFSEELPHYFDACTRFHGRKLGDGSGDDRVLACEDAGKGVLGEIVAALEQGFGDGSVRANLGEPMLTSIALWGFTHGIIQLAATKGEEIENTGITVPQLLDYSFDFLRGAMRAGAD